MPSQENDTQLYSCECFVWINALGDWMPHLLRSGEYRYIIYRIAASQGATTIADTLRYLAYRLEARVRPTNAQRARLVTEMLALQNSRAWSAYGVRLWYYIVASQFADPRLAKSLLACAKEEQNVHLQIWGFLAVASSASESRIREYSQYAEENEGAKLRSESSALGAERCSVFSVMLKVLIDGRAQVNIGISNPGALSSVDLEILILAYGRNQLLFADKRMEATFRGFIADQGIGHSSPLISEYSFWCSRMRKLKIKSIDDTLLDKNPHANEPRVRSAVYRLLGARDKKTRDDNWDFLSDRVSTESSNVCRFEIFSALSSRVGTYDKLLRTNKRKHLDSYIEWHMYETNQRCADRQFAFLTNNLEDSKVQQYVLEEIKASNRRQIEYYIPIIRRNRRLPSSFVSEMQRIGVLSVSEQLQLVPLKGHMESARASLPKRRIDRSVSACDSMSSIEDPMIGNVRMTDLETVVIATANRREAQGVLGELRKRSKALGFEVTMRERGILPHHEGRLLGRAGPRRAVVVRADETGPLDAAGLLRRIVDSFERSYIFYIGCAALLNEKERAEPNTVFVAPSAIDVDKREERDDGPSYDMDHAAGDIRVVRMANTLVDGGHFSPLKVITNRKFLSGSAFVKGRESKVRRQFVSDFPRDATVVEMEAYAVFKTARHLRDEGLDVSVSIIKGISDVADERAQDNKTNAQMRAARNAMRVACILLECL